jgi:rubrerythrin
MMTHEKIHELLHKEPRKQKEEGFPICKICNEEFLGHLGDEVCLYCELEKQKKE